MHFERRMRRIRTSSCLWCEMSCITPTNPSTLLSSIRIGTYTAPLPRPRTAHRARKKQAHCPVTGQNPVARRACAAFAQTRSPRSLAGPVASRHPRDASGARRRRPARLQRLCSRTATVALRAASDARAARTRCVRPPPAAQESRGCPGPLRCPPAPRHHGVRRYV